MSITEVNGKQFITQTMIDGSTFAAGQEVYLLDKQGLVMGNADLFHNNGKFVTTLHTHDVREWGEKVEDVGEHYIVVRFLSILPYHRNKPYPYHMPGCEVPETMKELQSGLNYFWDLNSLRLLPGDRPHNPLEGLEQPAASDPSSLPVMESSEGQVAPTQPSQSQPPSSEEVVIQIQPQPSNFVQLTDNPQLDASASAVEPSSQHSQAEKGVEMEEEAGLGSTRELVDLDEAEEEEEVEKVVSIHSEDEDVEEAGKELYDANEGVNSDEETGRMEEAEFNAKLYKQTRVRVSLDNIEVPPNTARDLDPSHAASISRGLLKYGSVKNIGDMAVVAKETPSNFNPAEGELLNMKVYITDGRHRRRAYQLAREKSHEWKEACKKLSISIWTRVDGQPISFLDLLAISTFLNQQSGNVRPITFKDSMYTAVSACKIIQDTAGDLEHRNKLSLAELVDHLLKSKALGNLKKKQVRRYAQIALRIGRSEMSYAVFMETCSRCEKLGAVHVASDVLLNLDDEGFKLALCCLEMRLRSNKSGNFEFLRRMFFLRVKELYDGVKDTATRHQKTVQEVLDAKMPITRTILMPVKERIWREMVTFDAPSSTVAKKEPTLSTDKDVILKGIEAIFADVEQVQQQVQQSNVVQAVGNTTQHVSIPAAAASSTPADTPTDMRRSTRLAEQAAQPRGSYKETARAPRTVTRRKKTSGGFSRRKKQPLEKEEIITALKNKTEEELHSILQSLHLSVVPISNEQQINRREQQQQQQRDEQDQSESDEEEETNRRFHTADSSFMDDITGLPFGYSLPRAYEGPSRPFWCRYANIIPSRWPIKNPIESVEPWLRYIHIPEHHRANVVLREPEILRSNHFIVHYRAAYNYFKDNSLDDVPIDEEMFKNVPSSDLPWAAAMQYDDVASNYFWEKKEELNDVGFTILPGFVDDENIPDIVGDVSMPVMYSDDKEVFSKLRDYTLGTYPTDEELKNGNNRSVWNTIINTGKEVDGEMNKSGVGRFTSTHKAVTKDMETKENVWACVARALLDVRIGSVLAAMRLYDNVNAKDKFMYTPKTGGRWLITSKGCLRQTVHTDFPSLSSDEFFSADACPGYFTITTGEKEVPLWVCKKSHKLLMFEQDDDAPNDVEMVLIPPNSIAVGRGDVIHAGASFEDSGTNDELLRYHLYFVPSTFSLPDGVFLDSSFKTKFVEPPRSNLLEEEIEPPIRRKRQRNKRSSAERPSKRPRVTHPSEHEDSVQHIQRDVFGSDFEE